ncbi:MAG: phage holin family protein [Chloroflexota bacterium]
MKVLRTLVDFYRVQLELVWRWRPGRRALIKRAIVSLIVGLISLGLTAAILPGIRIDGFDTLFWAVVVMAGINALLRPIVLALFASISTVAVIVATLLFMIASFFLVEWILPGFEVDRILSAFAGAIIFSAFNTLLTAIFSVDQDESYYGALVAQLARRRPDVIHSTTPGLVIIQIDGLAHEIVAHRIRAGYVPFMASWIRSGEMALDKWIALLPSQTSASQAGILHGNNSFIPAFRWWDKERQRMLVSNHPADAAEIVQRASNGEGLLSNDGASVSNLVSGDAVRSYVTMATMTDPQKGLGTSRAWYSFMISPDNYLRALVLSIAEVIKEYWQAIRSHRRHITPSMHRGMPYPIARAATNVVLRSLATSLVMEEMYHGTPVIYVDYTDYDEIAHHSGPERHESLDALDGVDSTIRSLVKSAGDAPRPYKFVVLSDHGQSLGSTFLQRYGTTLQEVVAGFVGTTDVAVATSEPEEMGALGAAVTEASRSTGATGALARSAAKNIEYRTELQPVAAEPGTAPPPKGAEDLSEPPEIVVCASGNLANIYFPRLSGRVTLEELHERWPSLVPGLVAHEGVGLLMVRSSQRGAVVFGKSGTVYLDEGKVDGDDPIKPYGEYARLGLERVDRMADCGDLLAISMLDAGTGEVAAFEELIGSHGGLGGAQTEPMILHPAEWKIDEPIVGAEAVYRQIRRWLEANGISLSKTEATAIEPAADTQVAVAATAATEPARGG